MEKETRIKCDRSYNELYGRRGILPEEAKSSAIREIARFYDSLEKPYVLICVDGIPRLCYLESIALYRGDTIHYQLYDDISGPGEQWERVVLKLNYKDNRRIVECYRYFKVDVFGDMDETFSEMIEKSDVRIPSQWDLRMAEYEDGIPVYNKTYARIEERRKNMDSKSKFEMIDQKQKNQKAASDNENYISMFMDTRLSEKHYFWGDYKAVNKAVRILGEQTCGVFGTGRGRRGEPEKDIVKRALAQPYIKEALKKKKNYYLLVSGPANLIEVNDMMSYLEKKVGKGPEIMWMRTGSVSKLYRPEDQDIVVTIVVVD